MNREIKFRAWNKENETMLKTFSFEDISTQNYAGESWLWLGENEMINTKLSDLVLMQFTGFTDAGKYDLYPDDIIENDGVFYRIEWCAENGSWGAIDIHNGENIALSELASIRKHGCKATSTKP